MTAVDQVQLPVPGGSDCGPAGLQALGTLPYQSPPYCARNWGHPFHSMCSYPSKIKPGIAHFLIKLLTRPGESVLDPFAGVGTIPFEACNQGRVGIGSDLNPLAAVVTRAKVSPPSRGALDAVVAELEDGVSHAPARPAVEEEIASFFHHRTLAEIVAARSILLGSLDSSGERGDASAFALACLAHILHGNRPYALSRRSHNVIPIPPKGDFVYKPLLPSLREKIQRLLAVPLNSSYRRGHAARLSFTDVGHFAVEVDHVISSPPFLGTTHFVRQNRVRLWLCGWDYSAQDDARPSFLEHQSGLEPYRPILACMYRVLKASGRCVLHLGVVKETDMATAISPYATAAGFAVEGIVYEDAAHLETHGRTDRGGTHRHQFLFLAKK